MPDEKVFNFTITMRGRGTTPEEAWEDAKTTFIDSDPDVDEDRCEEVSDDEEDE